MKSRNSDINIDAMRRLVVFGAIGIIALAFGWFGLNQNTEGRSKAADAEKIYRNWEFKGSLEGWVVENNTRLRSHPDSLRAEFPPRTGATIRQDGADADLPYGNKYLKVKLLLTPGIAILGVSSDESIINSQGLVSTGDGGYVTERTIQSGAGSGPGGSDIGPECIPGPNVECLTPEELENAKPIEMPSGDRCMPRPSCLDTPPYCRLEVPPGGWCRPSPSPKITSIPKPTPVPGGVTFDLSVYYQRKGKTEWEKPVVAKGLRSNGSLAEYSVLLPGIPAMAISKLKLQVSIVDTSALTRNDDYTLLIDYIRLVGPVPKLTPIPTRKPTPPVKPTCTPEPPCLYSEPACAMDPQPPAGGWCPRPTPTRKPTPKPTLIVHPTSGAGPVLYEAPPLPGKHWTCRLFPNRSWCK